MWHTRSETSVLEGRAQALLLAHAPDERRVEVAA